MIDQTNDLSTKIINDETGQLIYLSNTSVLKLSSYPKKFNDEFQQLINKATELGKIGNYQEAIRYFTEGERLLQYIANCGKRIERHILMNVLHNEAYLYDKLNMEEKSISYLNAIIFNIEGLISFLKQDENQPGNKNICEKLQKNKQKIYLNQTKCALSLYLLYLGLKKCQMQKYQTSIHDILAALQVIKEVCLTIALQKKRQKVIANEVEDYYRLGSLDFNIKTEDYTHYLNRAINLISKFKIVQFREGDQNFMNEINVIRNIKVQEVIILNFIEKSKLWVEIKMNQQNNNIAYYWKVIYLGIGLYLISQNLKKIPLKAIQSQIYHLFSIIVLASYIEFSTHVLDEIIQNYEAFYKNNLHHSLIEKFDEQIQFNQTDNIKIFNISYLLNHEQPVVKNDHIFEVKRTSLLEKSSSKAKVKKSRDQKKKKKEHKTIEIKKIVSKSPNKKKDNNNERGIQFRTQENPLLRKNNIKQKLKNKENKEKIEKGKSLSNNRNTSRSFEINAALKSPRNQKNYYENYNQITKRQKKLRSVKNNKIKN